MTAVIEVNQSQVNDVMAMLNGVEKDASIALSRSLNKTATGAKTLSAKGVGSTVTLKAKKIKEYITVRKANTKKLSAVVRLKGALMPSINFTNRKLAKGVSLKIWKSKRAIKLRHHFYATMPSGHAGIFSRKEIAPGIYSPRLPIEESFGPSVPVVYEKTPGLAKQVETESADRLLREMDAQVNFILSKYDG